MGSPGLIVQSYHTLDSPGAILFYKNASLLIFHTSRWTRFFQKDLTTTSWTDSILGPWLRSTSGTQSNNLSNCVIFRPKIKIKPKSSPKMYAGGSTWSRCLSRWAPRPASRWPPYSTSWTAPTTHTSGPRHRHALTIFCKLIAVLSYCLKLFFRSIFRHVVAAMKEAQDISIHLLPLKSHIKVKNWKRRWESPKKAAIIWTKCKL